MTRDERLELELAHNVYDVMQRAARGELAVAFLAARGELAEAPDDYQIAAAAVVEMCRQAFTGAEEHEAPCCECGDTVTWDDEAERTGAGPWDDGNAIWCQACWERVGMNQPEKEAK